MKIYTRKGDKCKTTLLGGVPVSKNNIRLEAYGTVDELIAHLALLSDFVKQEEYKSWILNIQDKLMIIAARLSYDGSVEATLPALQEEDVTWLEQSIDKMEAELSALQSFILPGGDVASSQAHVCRTICRRTERRIVSVYENTNPDELILKYMNRLSDFLFVFARYLLNKPSFWKRR